MGKLPTGVNLDVLDAECFEIHQNKYGCGKLVRRSLVANFRILFAFAERNVVHRGIISSLCSPRSTNLML